MIRATIAVLFALATSAPAQSPKAEERPLRVAVMDPAFEGDADARLKGALAQSFTAEVRKLQQVQAIAAEEIKQMLSFERTRQLIGCSEASCMTELVNALAADELVTVRIGQVGSTYSVAVQRLDARRAKVVQSFTRQLPRGSGEELLALVGQAIAALYPDRPLMAGRTRGVDTAVARRLNPPPLDKWIFFTTAGVGAAAGAVGAVFGVFADQSHSDWVNLVNDSATIPVSAGQLDGLKQRADAWSFRANAAFIAAGALAFGAIVEALLTDWNGDRDALRVAPAPAGVGLGISGSFHPEALPDPFIPSPLTDARGRLREAESRDPS